MPKKRSSHSHKRKNGEVSSIKAFALEETLIKNIVELQKIHVDMAEKFDKLSKEISQLLALFEATARNFARSIPPEVEKDKDFLEKIDRLLEQNKTLAKALTLMEESMRDRLYGSAPRQMLQPQTQMRPTFQQMPQQNTNQNTQQEKENEEYQPSMTGGNKPLPRV
ncbi:hypothetical protein HYV50_00390 [Candidatus Pacearchaeota archaeon]|nr:hypothetical protein [Candidatus Pacearchaeota archaeon]